MYFKSRVKRDTLLIEEDTLHAAEKSSPAISLARSSSSLFYFSFNKKQINKYASIGSPNLLAHNDDGIVIRVRGSFAVK